MQASDIRTLRDHLNLSQRRVAVLAHKEGVRVSQATVSLMEAGKAAVDSRYARWLSRKVYGNYKFVFDMPVKTLALAIRNRVEMEA